MRLKGSLWQFTDRLAKKSGDRDIFRCFGPVETSTRMRCPEWRWRRLRMMWREVSREIEALA